MKLTEALRINNATRSSSRRVVVYLATGFTPLPLTQFLAAHLSLRMEGCGFDVSTGSFGDLAGNVERIGRSHSDFSAVCVEWEDLDPRLGVRRLTSTTWRNYPEILSQAKAAKNHLLPLILAAAADRRVAVSLPHLPIPPLSHSPAHLMGEFEAELRLIVAEMQVELAGAKNVRLLRQNMSSCFDLSTTLHSGFPYTTEHASKLGEGLAKALVPSQPKKGIIVDLDDTLWKGILGDDGADGVHWDLDHKAQHHGLFQRLLHTLAAEGTLVAIASKNSPERVQEIFAKRSDLVLRAESVFPIEVHWQPKSESVARILAAWNVSADAVIFVDDSPLELAEVQAVHPQMLCLQFPSRDLGLFEAFEQHLRDAFAKDHMGEEDVIRSQSLRTRARLSSDTLTKADPEALLRDLEAELTFELGADAGDERALELINKTNQFNLNGVRIAEPFWRKALGRPGAFLLTCSYKDRFGALGKIAVLSGMTEGKTVVVESWVMSCRAFARRIEYACMQQIFEAFGADRLILQHKSTERNGPVHDLLQSMQLDSATGGEVTISREQFAAKVPALYHRVVINSRKSEVETNV